MKTSHVLSGLFVALLVVGSAHTAQAQSTIFNIPSTDTVSLGKAYGEFDLLIQAPGFDGVDKTVLYNPRVLVGVAKNVEAGLNFPIFTGAGDTLSYIEPNAKWKFLSNDDSGVAAAVGGVFHTALNHREGQNSFGLVYGNVSKKIGMSGPRFHAGPYGIIASDEDFGGPRGGVLVGYEQPIAGTISFVADWFSGKNYYGYFTPGVSIVMGNGLLNVGYSIGNDSWEDSNATKNRYFFAYYGMTF